MNDPGEGVRETRDAQEAAREKPDAEEAAREKPDAEDAAREKPDAGEAARERPDGEEAAREVSQRGERSPLVGKPPHGEDERGQKVDIDRLFQALGDPTRRGILDRLSEGPMSVSRLAAPLDMTLTAVMQHLQVLEESGLVRTEKLGRVRTCRIEAAGFSALEEWIRDHRSVWEKRLDRLGDLLGESGE